MARLFRTVLLVALSGILWGSGGGSAQENPLQEFRLGLPLMCVPGIDCFVQNYVDVQPNDEFEDYQCNAMGYNGHKGVDFRIPSLAVMEEGVSVVASAAGTVLGFRDGEIEGYISDRGIKTLNGKDCGNGVLLGHGQGWATQYCHLKKGSISVAKGDRIEKGQTLGQVGMSGRTDFPHVHISVRHNKQVIDPFVGDVALSGCADLSASNLAPLWDENLTVVLAYRQDGFLRAGFSAERPTVRSIDSGHIQRDRMSREEKLLILYGMGFGLLAGDQVLLRITAPDGSTLVENLAKPVASPKAQYLQFSGIKSPKDGLIPGLYKGHFALVRKGQEISSVSADLIVE